MEDFNNYTFYKECLWDELIFNMYMNVFDEACCCCCWWWCCIWTSSMRHFKCVHVFWILCSNCIWFVMRNLLLILLMMSWEIIRVGDYEYFVHDFLDVQFFWFNLIEKKIEKSQWVLAQMIPHFHIRECIPWLCVNLPQKNSNLH